MVENIANHYRCDISYTIEESVPDKVYPAGALLDGHILQHLVPVSVSMLTVRQVVGQISPKTRKKSCPKEV